MDRDEKIDVIVVGAGPSGVSCATTVARAGHKVLVLEKASNFGVKNMFGGAVYLNSIKELFPASVSKLPAERLLVDFNYVILNEKNAITVSYKNKENKTAAAVTRYAFDTFLAEEARCDGVYFANNTLAVDLIKENGKIIGVKTENEDIFADIVVLAEGFNSLLAYKAGLKKKIKPKSAILAVKETIKIPYETINQRFNLKENEGSLYEFFGGLAKENEDAPFAMGFLYTFKNSVTIGLGISMENLKNGKIKPHEYLDRLKNNEFVSSLIEGGEVVEYSAHSIPEGGYKELPQLYDNGVLLVGDCANLVDSVHFEGTNLAIKSGILAGETCNLAIEKQDFSKKVLKNYKKKLFRSFVIKDLRAYKNVISTLYNRRETVFSYMPKKVDEFFKNWTTADNAGKKAGYRRFLGSILFKRSIIQNLKDVISFVKCVLGAII